MEGGFRKTKSLLSSKKTEKYDKISQKSDSFHGQLSERKIIKTKDKKKSSKKEKESKLISIDISMMESERNDNLLTDHFNEKQKLQVPNLSKVQSQKQQRSKTPVGRIHSMSNDKFLGHNSSFNIGNQKEDLTAGTPQFGNQTTSNNDDLKVLAQSFQATRSQNHLIEAPNTVDLNSTLNQSTSGK